MQIAGTLKKKIADILEITLEDDTNIYISDSNIEHIKASHPLDFEKYYQDIPKIINAPDYVGLNPKDNSIEFVKEYRIDDEYVKVAVRISKNKKYFVRSLYKLNTRRVKNFIEKNTLKSLDK